MEPNRYSAQQAQTRETTFDAGLRSHFQRVYNIMVLGLVVTGITAYVTSQIPAMVEFLINAQSGLTGLLIMFSPMILIMMFFNPAAMRKFSSTTLTFAFLGFSAYFGWLFSLIFLAYAGADIARVFFITSAMFAAMSIWGYTTKKDLSGMSSFLMMGIIGLIIAIVVNAFMQSSMLMFGISCAGVLIYTLLTAWDTQMIKQTYHESNGREGNAKLAVMGALSLYINFIMMFQFLLSLLGGRD